MFLLFHYCHRSHISTVSSLLSFPDPAFALMFLYPSPTTDPILLFPLRFSDKGNQGLIIDVLNKTDCRKLREIGEEAQKVTGWLFMIRLCILLMPFILVSCSHLASACLSVCFSNYLYLYLSLCLSVYQLVILVICRPISPDEEEAITIKAGKVD